MPLATGCTNLSWNCLQQGGLFRSLAIEEAGHRVVLGLADQQAGSYSSTLVLLHVLPSLNYNTCLFARRLKLFVIRESDIVPTLWRKQLRPSHSPTASPGCVPGLLPRIPGLLPTTCCPSTVRGYHLCGRTHATVLIWFQEDTSSALSVSVSSIPRWFGDGPPWFQLQEGVESRTRTAGCFRADSQRLREQGLLRKCP